MLYRTTTRVCHSKGLVEFGERTEHIAPAYQRNVRKFVCTPANAYMNHPIVEERLAKLAEYGCTRALENGLNKLELGDGKVGVITASISIGRLFPQITVEREDGAYRRELPAPALALAGQEMGGPLWQYFAGSGQAPLLARMEQARSMGRGRLSPQAVQTLYGRRIAMSASRIDRLKSCHFGYFMEYGLRAKERTSAGFEAPEVGTFIHYLLENVNRDVCARGGYGEVDKPALRQLVHHYVDLYAQTMIDGYDQKGARFRYLFSRLRHLI